MSNIVSVVHSINKTEIKKKISSCTDNQKSKIKEILELMHGSNISISKRYVEIYNKPTGYNSIKEMKGHIKDCEKKAAKLIAAFNEESNKDFYKDFYSNMEYYHRNGVTTSLKDAFEYEKQQYNT